MLAPPQQVTKGTCEKYTDQKRNAKFIFSTSIPIRKPGDATDAQRTEEFFF